MSSNDSRPERDREHIDPTFRTGSITVVGILVAFSLGFLTAWSSNPVPWGAKDLPGYIGIVVGLILELIALALLLSPESLEVRHYRFAIRVFLTGLVLVALGVVLALVVDFRAVSDVGRA